MNIKKSPSHDKEIRDLPLGRSCVGGLVEIRKLQRQMPRRINVTHPDSRSSGLQQKASASVRLLSEALRGALGGWVLEQ